MNEFFPRAADVAAAMRARGSDRYTWMTQGWLISLFYDCKAAGILSWDGKGTQLLQCPNASTVSKVTAAIKNGDIW